MTSSVAERELTVRLRRPHEKQQSFIDCPAPRIIIRAGRRGGKTVGIAIHAIKRFLAGARVLYATPTAEQLDSFWFEAKRALAEPIEQGVYYKNESLHIIEQPGTKQRIRAKTAWNADTLRGDYADLLILDEYQLMSEDAWELVGAPMLLDNDGAAVFIYTPPSLHSRSRTKARDPRHASKLFTRAKADESGRWATFHFASHDNPHISAQALVDLASDMTGLAYRQEILAEDVEEVAGALWTLETLEKCRVSKHPLLSRVVVAVDPPGGLRNECGIVVVGLGEDTHCYVLDDRSLAGSPSTWAAAVITGYNRNNADRVVGEVNYGGTMVEQTIVQTAKAMGQDIAYKAVSASRGKAIRAEPVAAAYERGEVHHIGQFDRLEEELTGWVPGESQYSPNRLDALVWAVTELTLGGNEVWIQ